MFDSEGVKMPIEPETQQPILPEPTPGNKPEFKKSQSKEEPRIPEIPAEKAVQFATEYFQTLGLAVCSKCGSKKQTDGFGKIICAIGITVKKDCPILADKEGK